MESIGMVYENGKYREATAKETTEINARRNKPVPRQVDIIGALNTLTAKVTELETKTAALDAKEKTP